MLTDIKNIMAHASKVMKIILSFLIHYARILVCSKTGPYENIFEEIDVKLAKILKCRSKLIENVTAITGEN
jgi:hypothetical protein